MTGPFARSYRRRRAHGKSDTAAGESTVHLLGGSVEEYLTNQGMSSVTSLAHIIECWPKIVGEQVAAHATPSKIIDDELVILVDHPAWATELRLSAAKIISQLENEFKTPVVSGLKVHVRN